MKTFIGSISADYFSPILHWSTKAPSELTLVVAKSIKKFV